MFVTFVPELPAAVTLLDLFPEPPDNFEDGGLQGMISGRRMQVGTWNNQFHRGAIGWRRLVPMFEHDVRR